MYFFIFFTDLYSILQIFYSIFQIRHFFTSGFLDRNTQKFWTIFSEENVAGNFSSHALYNPKYWEFSNSRSPSLT